MTERQFGQEKCTSCGKTAWECYEIFRSSNNASSCCQYCYMEAGVADAHEMDEAAYLRMCNEILSEYPDDDHDDNDSGFGLFVVFTPDAPFFSMREISMARQTVFSDGAYASTVQLPVTMALALHGVEIVYETLMFDIELDSVADTQVRTPEAQEALDNHAALCHAYRLTHPDVRIMHEFYRDVPGHENTDPDPDDIQTQRSDVIDAESHEVAGELWTGEPS